MSKGGSGGTQTVTQQTDPWTQAQQAGMLNFGVGAVNQPYQPYYGDRVAGFTPDQISAFDQAANFYNTAQQNAAPAMSALQNIPQISYSGSAPSVSYSPYSGNVSWNDVNASVNYDPVAAAIAQYQTGTASTFQPVANMQGQTYNAQTGSAQTVDPSQLQTIDPQTLAGTNLDPYMNPYQQEVIDRSLSNLERQRQIQALNTSGAATAAGSYGGSRHGVADSLTNEAFLRSSGDLAAQLWAQNYNQAQNAAVGDISRDLQAQSQNQAADYNLRANNMNAQNQFNMANLGFLNNAAQFNAAAEQNADLANMNALNTGGMFNAGQNQAMELANMNAFNNAQQFNAGQQNSVNLANASNSMSADQANANIALANSQGNLSADQANANIGLQNAANQLSASQANANLAMQNNQLGLNAQIANAGNQLSAAGMMGTLGNNLTNAYGTQIGLMSGFGNQQQQYNQNLLNQDYQDFMALQGYPLQQAQNYQSLVGGITPGQISQQPLNAGNPLAGAIGGGLAGYGVAGPYGAAIGALGGLL